MRYRASRCSSDLVTIVHLCLLEIDSRFMVILAIGHSSFPPGTQRAVPRCYISSSSPSSQISCPSPSQTSKLVRNPQTAMQLRNHQATPITPWARLNP